MKNSILLLALAPTLMLITGCGLWPTLCGDGETPCSADEFCFFQKGDCGESGVGACAPRPDACAQIFEAVCGCDGQTYGNECEAWAAGVSVAADGPCD